MADVIIKPTRHDDFYLIYSTVSGSPHTWGSRAQLESQVSDLHSKHLDTAGLYGSSESVPRNYGWSQRYLMIDTRYYNRRPHYQLCDDATPFVEREKLQEFCQSWEPDYKQFMPPPGVVTWRCECHQGAKTSPVQRSDTDFPLVVVESPYAASNPQQRQEYYDYARAAIKDCLDRGEAPFASHLLYTQPGVLDDDNPAERSKGIAAGFAWMQQAHTVAVYTDLGISPGMVKGIHNAQRNGTAIVFRTLDA